MRRPRFELVRGNDAAQPWHARFRAANGQVVWTTEQYARRGGAVKAINVMAGVRGAPQSIANNHSFGVRDVGYGVEIDFGLHGLLEVREVDERDHA